MPDIQSGIDESPGDHPSLPTEDIEIRLSTCQLRGIMGNRTLMRVDNEAFMVIWGRGK